MDFASYLVNKMGEIESVIIGAKTTISTILNKYPAHWIDGICDNLKVQRSSLHKKEKIAKILDKILQNAESILAGISEEEKKCLRVVAGAGGMLKYSKLKEFGDEMPYWWPEHGVNSTIEKLRSKGLLFVGKTMISGRFYKMALIARELVPKIQGK